MNADDFDFEPNTPKNVDAVSEFEMQLKRVRPVQPKLDLDSLADAAQITKPLSAALLTPTTSHSPLAPNVFSVAAIACVCGMAAGAMIMFFALPREIRQPAITQLEVPSGANPAVASNTFNTQSLPQVNFDWSVQANALPGWSWSSPARPGPLRVGTTYLTSSRPTFAEERWKDADSSAFDGDGSSDLQQVNTSNFVPEPSPTRQQLMSDLLSSSPGSLL